MSNRGRPRKDGPRYESGDLKPAQDNGPAEAQAKRNNVIDAAELLLALRQIDLITIDQYEAGSLYAGLRYAVYGQPFARVAAIMVAKGDPEPEDVSQRDQTLTAEERDARRKARYESADMVLRSVGAKAYKSVVQIAYERQRPDWLVAIAHALHSAKTENDPKPLIALALTGLMDELDDFRAGLDALVVHFGRVRKERADKIRGWRAEEAA